MTIFPARLLALALALPLILAMLSGPIPPAPAPGPTPSWHTMGTWSGTTGGKFATLSEVPNTQGVRILWTCQIPGNGGTSSWGLDFAIGGPLGGGVGPTGGCDASHLSGIWGPNQCGDGTLLTYCSFYVADATDAIGPWTAQLQEWY